MTSSLSLLFAGSDDVALTTPAAAAVTMETATEVRNPAWNDSDVIVGGGGSSRGVSDAIALTYSTICLLGLLGNGLVIYVVLRYAKMKTVTNTYILNLAIADACFLAGLPLLVTTVLVQRWIFGQLLCKVFYILTCVTFTSFFTVSKLQA